MTYEAVHSDRCEWRDCLVLFAVALCLRAAFAWLMMPWNNWHGDEAEYLRVYMGKLRQKIEGDPLNPEYLLTERGIGYQFKG